MFEQTAEKFNLNPVILTGFGNFVCIDWFPELIAEIKAVTTPYILLTDSFDVLVARWNEQEAIRMVDRARGNLILSGEPAGWPDGPWTKNYKEPFPSLWPFACGGQEIGTKEAILNLTQITYDRRKEVNIGGNQELLHVLVGEDYPMEIDSGCNIFQCMRTEVARFVEPRTVGKWTIPYNTLTQSWPMFLHFNDLAHTPGMPEWFEILKQNP